MKKIFTIFFFFTFITQNFCNAQFKKQLDRITNLYNSAASDSDKVIALGQLADLYYTYKLNQKADSILQEQLKVSELSDNNNLILATLFGAAITKISPSTTSESFDKTIQFLEKGINYAKSKNLNEYLGSGYNRMANILRNRGQYDKALNNAILSIQTIPHIASDSIKAAIYIELGNIYEAKGEAVSASTNYNTAFDIAIKIKSIPLQSEIYHCFSEMYSRLGYNDVAIDELKKSLALNKKYNYGEGMVRDYFDLARLTDEKFYIEKSIQLSNSLNFYKYIIDAKRLMLYYYMVAEKNDEKALNYLENEPEVKESFLNNGIANYYRTKGQIYLYSNKADSALHYFKLAEYDFVNKFDEKLIRALFREIAQSYQLLHNMPNAIAYYTKVLQISKRMNDINTIASVSDELSKIYEQQNDYKQAFFYAKQFKKNKDSLSKLSGERDIALLGVIRENRKHDEELRQEMQKLNNKRNIQYMAITIAIAVIFILMLIIGMFPISKLTIKLLGYIFFISLFEFIVLLIDTFLHKITHGEPLKIWLIKIFLIALLVPLQHFLEHRLIKFLESRKLLEARTKFSFKRWWQKVKKPAPAAAGLEEDIGVL